MYGRFLDMAYIWFIVHDKLGLPQSSGQSSSKPRETMLAFCIYYSKNHCATAFSVQSLYMQIGIIEVSICGRLHMDILICIPAAVMPRSAIIDRVLPIRSRWRFDGWPPGFRPVPGRYRVQSNSTN